MNDLMAYHGIGTRGTSTPTSLAQVDADISRGRRAAHRRQVRQAGTGTALVAVLAIGVSAVTAPTGQHHSTQAGVTATASLGIKLVDFSGTQPSGFTLARVPQGWSIETSNPYFLVIAPTGMAHPDPENMVGKLIVTFEPAPPTDLSGTSIAVGPGTGLVRHDPDPSGGGPSALLDFQSPSGQWVRVQSSSALGWTDQQVAGFAAGVTVTPDAKRPPGWPQAGN
jgi:hypothetical protein